MKRPCCGKCLFAEDIGSSDMIHCWKKKEYRKVNDYPCGMYRSTTELLGETSED